MARRKHSKIQELPNPIKAAVDNLLAQGFTYAEISAELKSRGHTVSKSTVGRYAKDIAEAARELNLVTEQLRPVLAQVAENPNLELGSVATQMGLMQVIKFLKSEKLEDEENQAAALRSICQAAAQLHRSQAAVEKYRLEYREKKAKADKELEKLAAGKGITPDVVARIKGLYSL